MSSPKAKIDFALPPKLLRWLDEEVFAQSSRIVDLGCGRRKHPGAIGVDTFPSETVDVRHDLNLRPYPFADDFADIVILRHVIEHLDDVMGTMREIGRILRPGGKAIVLTPHFSDASSWTDPTHRWHLGTRSIEEASKGMLGLRMTYVRFRRRWQKLGLERIVNNAPLQPRVPKRVVSWENDWCFLVRGGEMTFVLEKVTGSPDCS